MGRPRLLDLFCGAGGCAVGYHRAGFDVVGVDHRPQPRYPFEFVQSDAMEALKSIGDRFDAVHASPPCQGYSQLRHLPWLKGKEYPKLIGPCRDLLASLSRPWVIENVEFAPLVGPVLCGLMFGLPVFRHRRFEASFLLLGLSHAKHGQVIGAGGGVNCRKQARPGSLNAGSRAGAWGRSPIVTVAGNQFRKKDGARALGIDWMLKPELAQAIPPAYTEFVGRQLIERV